MSSHELPLTSLPSPHPHTPCPLTSAQTSLKVSTEIVKVCSLTIPTGCLRVPENKGLEISHLSFLDRSQLHRLPQQLSAHSLGRAGDGRASSTCQNMCILLFTWKMSVYLPTIFKTGWIHIFFSWIIPFFPFKPGRVAHMFNPSPQEAERQVYLCEFKVSSSTAKAAQWDPVSVCFLSFTALFYFYLCLCEYMPTYESPCRSEKGIKGQLTIFLSFPS